VEVISRAKIGHTTSQTIIVQCGRDRSSIGAADALGAHDGGQPLNLIEARCRQKSDLPPSSSRNRAGRLFFTRSPYQSVLSTFATDPTGLAGAADVKF
jgi:hypothetical protein